MKTIVLEFVGGCWNGQCLRSDARDPTEAKLAKKFYWAVDCGAVGKCIASVTSQDVHFMRHHRGETNGGAGVDTPPVYVVISCGDEGDATIIRLGTPAAPADLPTDMPGVVGVPC